MRRISAMYQLSGGANYNHTCGECANCIRITVGKRKVTKCSKYRKLSGTDPDWKVSYMACRFFRVEQATPKKDPVEQVIWQASPDAIEGQISIFDLTGGESARWRSRRRGWNRCCMARGVEQDKP